MGDDSNRLSEWHGRQVLEDCRRGHQRCHECQDWGCCDNINEDRPAELAACRRSGPTEKCRTCPEPICRWAATTPVVPYRRKEGKPMSVPYRFACWAVGWLGAIVLLALLWSGEPCGR